MQSAETILDVLRERGRRGLPLDELYRQLFNPQLYLLAYGRIYSNKGAMTPGPDAETADGMTLGKIERIIDALRHERYRFKPVRRHYIPKKDGKQRPLGLPSWSDKLLGEVIRLLLEAYYEPQFSDHSHGYRPGRGCHTALREVAVAWTGTTWFIEGDISQRFDRLDHQMTFSGTLSLNSELGEVRSFFGEGKGGQQELDMEHLSTIVEVLNERFGTELTDVDKLLFDQFEETWVADGELSDQAQNNSIENFKLVFDRKFLQTIVTRMDANSEIFKRILDDDEFRELLGDYYVKKGVSRHRCGDGEARMRSLSRGFAAGIVACESSAGPTGACGGGWRLREVVARGLDARETPAGTTLRAPIAVPRGNEPVTRNDSDLTTSMPREPKKVYDQLREAA